MAPHCNPVFFKLIDNFRRIGLGQKNRTLLRKNRMELLFFVVVVVVVAAVDAVFHGLRKSVAVQKTSDCGCSQMMRSRIFGTVFNASFQSKAFLPQTVLIKAY